MQSVLGADCAVTAVVGEERAACNEEKQKPYLAKINYEGSLLRYTAHMCIYICMCVCV